MFSATGAMGEQGEVLEHHAHAMAADVDQLSARCREKVDAREVDGPGCRLDQP